MFEIVEAIHKALHTDSTWWFVTVVAVCFAVVGSGTAWLVDAGYKNSAEYKMSHQGPKDPPPPTAGGGGAIKPSEPPTPPVPPVAKAPKKKQDSGCTPASLQTQGDASLSIPPRGPNVGFIGGRGNTVEKNSKSLGFDVGFDDSCSQDVYRDKDVAVRSGDDLTQWYATLLAMPSLDKASLETAIASEQDELNQWGRHIRPDIISKLRGLEGDPIKLKNYLESVVHPESRQHLEP
jgi:hypothetical protein